MSDLADTTPDVSVVIPVYNGGMELARCLDALFASRGVRWECIVVDDGSTDGAVEQARSRGVRVIQASSEPRGPGHARNAGAAAASAPLVLFLDADVLVRPDTLHAFVEVFAADPELVAAFGSYDAEPEARTTVSDFRNLLHHFTHQEGREAASTFWAGCGAIRRDAFLAVGGFAPAYGRPSVEDIELGYRLRANGAKIRLVKQIQVKHLKHWTFWKMVRTDVRDRALAWTELIARSGLAPDDLNLRMAGRLSALGVHALLAVPVLAWRRPVAWLGLVGLAAMLVVLNRGLYGLFLRRRGLWFTVRAVPLHWLYYVYSSQTFVVGMAWYRLCRRSARSRLAQRAGKPMGLPGSLS